MPETVVNRSVSLLARRLVVACSDDKHALAALALPVNELELSYSKRGLYCKKLDGAAHPPPRFIIPDISFQLHGMCLGTSLEPVVPLVVELKAMYVDGGAPERALFRKGVVQAAHYLARLLLTHLDCVPAARALPRLEACAFVANGRTTCFARAVLTHDDFAVYITPPVPFMLDAAANMGESAAVFTPGMELWACVLSERPKELLGADMLDLLKPFNRR